MNLDGALSPTEGLVLQGYLAGGLADSNRVACISIHFRPRDSCQESLTACAWPACSGSEAGSYLRLIDFRTSEHSETPQHVRQQKQEKGRDRLNL